MATTAEELPCWLKDHPVIKEIKSHGANPIQGNAAIAVYFDLTEVKEWREVSIHPCPPLEMVYLTGEPPHSHTDCPHYILPLSSHTTLTVELIDSVFQYLKLQPDHEGSGKEQQKISLALVDSEGSVVYYHIQQGLPTHHSQHLSDKSL